MKTIRVGGFFTGIGAHVSACDRLESEDIHFEHIFQCEFDRKTEQGFNVLHSNHGVIRNLGDIRGVHDIGGDLQVDILFPSPPCQDISTAGLQKGNSKDSGTRSALAFEVPRIIRNTPPSERPRYMVMEEVPMMMSKKFMPNLLEYLGELSELGYQHNYAILNSADYGVAQSRRRFYCISKLGGKAPAMPEPFPLTKCLRDYLDPEPVADHYYLSKERIEGLIWSTDKQSDKGNNFAFKPTDGGGDRSDLDEQGRNEEDGQLCPNPIIEARPRIRKFANKGRVYGMMGTLPPLSAHQAKDAEYLVSPSTATDRNRWSHSKETVSI